MWDRALQVFLLQLWHTGGSGMMSAQRGEMGEAVSSKAEMGDKHCQSAE